MSPGRVRAGVPKNGQDKSRNPRGQERSASAARDGGARRQRGGSAQQVRTGGQTRGSRRSFNQPSARGAEGSRYLPAGRVGENRSRQKPADLGTRPAEVRAGIHAVEEALRAGKVTRLFLHHEHRDRPRLAALARLADERDVPVQFLTGDALEVRAQLASHQGAIAEIKPFRYLTLDELLEGAEKRDEAPFFLVLDGVEDPQNLGSILRTADASGVHGVVLPERRAAPVTAVVARASAGAVDHVPVAQVTNLSRALGTLKERGAWVYALDMDGTQAYDAVDYTGPVVIVAGGEGKGVSRLVREHADAVISIPLSGRVESLNVSVATALALYAVRRSRDRQPPLEEAV